MLLGKDFLEKFIGSDAAATERCEDCGEGCEDCMVTNVYNLLGAEFDLAKSSLLLNALTGDEFEALADDYREMFCKLCNHYWCFRSEERCATCAGLGVCKDKN